MIDNRTCGVRDEGGYPSAHGEGEVWREGTIVYRQVYVFRKNHSTSLMIDDLPISLATGVRFEPHI